ncbi:MAG: WG repeat-containing protein [Alloprevotella sp.]
MTDAKGKKGYANEQGAVVIAQQYTDAQPFENGLAIVGKKGKFGVINTSGTFVIPMTYSSIEAWGENLFMVAAGKKIGLYNQTGAEVLKPEYSHISRLNCHGLAWIVKGGKVMATKSGSFIYGGKWGVVTSKGSVKVAPTYAGLMEFTDTLKTVQYHEGLALSVNKMLVTDTLKTDGEFFGFNTKASTAREAGILDANGNILMPTGIATWVIRPANGMVRCYNLLSKVSNFGYYNLETKRYFQVSSDNKSFDKIEYWTHTDFAGKFAVVNHASGWFFVDKDGNKVREGYNYVGHCKKTKVWYARRNSDKVCDVFDEDGNPFFKKDLKIQDASFPETTMADDLFAVQIDGKWGMINRAGEEKIPFNYLKMNGPNYDRVMTKTENGWGAIDLEGNVVVENNYKDIYTNPEASPRYFWVQNTGSGLWQAYDTTDKTAKGSEYATVYNFKDGYAFVIPQGFAVDTNSELIKFQLGKTYTKADNKVKVMNDNKKYFGMLIDSNLDVQCEGPLYLGHRAVAVEAAKKVGKPFTKAQNKALLLYLTRQSRSYNFLNGGSVNVIKEENWDF